MGAIGPLLNMMLALKPFVVVVVVFVVLVVVVTLMMVMVGRYQHVRSTCPRQHSQHRSIPSRQNSQHPVPQNLQHSDHLRLRNSTIDVREQLELQISHYGFVCLFSSVPSLAVEMNSSIFEMYRSTVHVRSIVDIKCYMNCCRHQFCLQPILGSRHPKN